MKSGREGHQVMTQHREGARKAGGAQRVKARGGIQSLKHLTPPSQVKNGFGGVKKASIQRKIRARKEGEAVTGRKPSRTDSIGKIEWGTGGDERNIGYWKKNQENGLPQGYRTIGKKRGMGRRPRA